MTLYIVPTPIGHLKDITIRAIEVLKEVDFIIAEDTRHTRKLLTHLGIRKPLVSYFKHREKEKTPHILSMLATQTGALVSDSGTPLISDPGHHLVQQAIAAGIEVIALPGPSALIPALVASGIDPGSFLFLGFPPRKKGELLRLFKELAPLPYTLVFYESAKRLSTLIEIAYQVLADRAFAVAREISKINESIIRGRLGEWERLFAGENLLGEMVVIIERNSSGSGQEVKPEIHSLDDLFAYFKDHHQISKNRLKQILMKK